MATHKQITNANYGKEEEQYTGFVFQFTGIGKHNLDETAEMLLCSGRKRPPKSSSGSSFPPKGDWYCARISLVKGNAGGLKPLEGT